jgi:tetratricopeptide (TPR) repeat protein
VNRNRHLITILAVCVSFAAGFLVANFFNRNELNELKTENERLRTASSDAALKNAEFTLSEYEIRAKIAEADGNQGNFDFQKKLGIALSRYGSMKQDTVILGEAARLLQRAYGMEETDKDVLTALGNTYLDIGYLGKEPKTFEVARNFFEKAVQADSRNSEIRADLALTYFLQEPPDLDKAVLEFEAALALDTKNERALQFLTESYWKLSRPDDAQKSLAKLKELNPKHPAINDLASLMSRPAESK